MQNENEVQIAIRSAQSSFVRRGYSKEQSFQFGREVVEDVIANLSDYQEVYHETDIFELVHLVSEDIVKSL